MARNETAVITDREQLVFGRTLDWEEDKTFGGGGSVAKFAGVEEPPSHATGTGITLGTLQVLLDAGHVDPDSRQNGSPTASEFVSIGQKIQTRWPDVELRYIGYMVSTDRPDTRITIEGFEVEPSSGCELSRDLQLYVRETFDHYRGPNELTVEPDYVRIWYD